MEAGQKTAAEGQIQRIIRDLHEAVSELWKEHQEGGEPVTDDSANLHKFCHKLEYLLQFDLKVKSTFLGSRKDYWDYFTDCLAKIKGANDGIRFVRSIPELKTSLGKGRAFLRYSLVHQRLGDTVQQCLINSSATRDWFNSRSPFQKAHLRADIVNHLYELNDVRFDLASRGHDLDSEWPSFARRTLGSPGNIWKPPSRSSSISSLASSYSQVHEFSSSLDFAPGPLLDISTSASSVLNDSSASALDELRLELDQSELKQQELLEQMGQLGVEAVELRGVVVELQNQLDLSLAAQADHQELQRNLQALTRELDVLRGREGSRKDLQENLSAVERKNEELMARLERVLSETGQRAEKDFDSAQKIHQLLSELKEAEKGRSEAVAEEERLAEDLRKKERALTESELKVASLCVKVEELQKSTLGTTEENADLHRQLRDLHHSLDANKAEQERMCADGEVREKEMSGEKEELERQLKAKDAEILSMCQRVHALEKEAVKLESEKQGLRDVLTKMEASATEQAEKTGEILEDKCVLQSQLAASRASEKHLRAQIQDEEKRGLEEKLQQARTKLEASESSVQRLELENKGLTEVQATLKSALAVIQEDVLSINAQISGLEKSLEDARRNEANLMGQLKDKDSRLQEHEATAEKLEAAKAEAEQAVEKQAQKIQHLEALGDQQAREAQEMSSRMEEQLGLSVEEVSRLHEELLDLRTKLLAALEEKERSRAQLEVSESSLAELQVLTEGLRSTAEEQNRLHVQELLSAQEELLKLKLHNQQLLLENAESRESLHRLNTEMAELGMSVCRLTAEGQRWAEEASCVQELQERGMKEVERLEQEKLRLEERLQRSESERDAAQEETTTLRFQMSAENISLQNLIKGLTEDEEVLRARLDAETRKTSELEDKSTELEAVNQGFTRLLEERDTHLSVSESRMRVSECETQRLRETLASAQESAVEVQRERDALRLRLEQVLCETGGQFQQMSAELEDLGQTKTNLEERLIQLIRDKDALWQKSDELEFQQKLRAEEQWWLLDKEASRCLQCHALFTWMMRRHHCRLCGRIFCYYCSNNYVMAKSGKKERCCGECYTQHNTPEEHTHTLTDAEEKAYDGAFDIITEEEVNQIYDGDTQDDDQSGDHSSSEATPDDPDESAPPPQDSELTLLQSGELTASVHMDLQEIGQFGHAPRELFVKSSGYSVIAIAVSGRGPIISWVFSSEPKSISFTVLYSPSLHTPAQQAKVLIPLTRCSAHKETVRGQLNAHTPGIYTLVFDNSFSRFLSKKVNYRLSTEQPIIYDGSDLV